MSTNISPLNDHRFIYDAVIESVYDADTVTLCVDLGFGLKREKHKCRLYGINAPEVRGPERPKGIEARNWLRSRLPVGTAVVIKSHRDKTGKFGRWLATIFKDGVNLNDKLVELGMAEYKEY